MGHAPATVHMRRSGESFNRGASLPLPPEFIGVELQSAGLTERTFIHQPQLKEIIYLFANLCVYSNIPWQHHIQQDLTNFFLTLSDNVLGSASADYIHTHITYIPR